MKNNRFYIINHFLLVLFLAINFSKLSVGQETSDQNLVQVAKIGFRLGFKDVIGDYRTFANSYPVCKARMDLLHVDSDPGRGQIDLFDTKTAHIEKPINPYHPNDNTIQRIRKYEEAGWNVASITIYREDWIDGTGGPFEEDRRILSQEDIDFIMNGIANADPPLNCKNTLKIYQLLGGRTKDQSGDSWLSFDNDMKEYLKQFDGIGTECHFADHIPPAHEPDGPTTLQAMAHMSKWAGENGKTAFVFMGGTPASYEDLYTMQDTYYYLWDEMAKIGVNHRAEHIFYFRQGARPGNHLPENENNTLTHQMKWLIEEIKNVPHISSVDLGSGSITFGFPDSQYEKSTIEFSVDGGKTYSMQALVADGSASFTGLAKGSYNVWVRWGDGACPMRLGIYTITEDTHTAIAGNIASNTSLLIYPNPNNGRNFNIKLPQDMSYDKGQLQILNIHGQVVSNHALVKENELPVNINPRLSKGIYFLRYSYSGQSLVTKFTVE